MAEFCTEWASEDYEPINFDFLDKDLMDVPHVEEKSSEKTCWKLYFDGASNALGHRIDVVLITPEGEYCPFTARLDFNCTNNVVEYEACAMGLQAVIDKRIKKLEVYGDSTLVIYQLREEWKTWDSRLIFYHKHITDIIKHFNEINFNHLSQEENQMANVLATFAAMFQMNSSDEVQPIRIRLKETPTHCA